MADGLKVNFFAKFGQSQRKAPILPKVLIINRIPQWFVWMCESVFSLLREYVKIEKTCVNKWTWKPKFLIAWMCKFAYLFAPIQYSWMFTFSLKIFPIFRNILFCVDAWNSKKRCVNSWKFVPLGGGGNFLCHANREEERKAFWSARNPFYIDFNP